jgi:hypothetical protein
MYIYIHTAHTRSPIDVCIFIIGLPINISASRLCCYQCRPGGGGDVSSSSSYSNTVNRKEKETWSKGGALYMWCVHTRVAMAVVGGVGFKVQSSVRSPPPSPQKKNSISKQSQRDIQQVTEHDQRNWISNVICYYILRFDSSADGMENIIIMYWEDDDSVQCLVLKEKKNKYTYKKENSIESILKGK